MHRSIRRQFTTASEDAIREINAAHSCAFTMAFAFAAMSGAFVTAHFGCPNYVRFLLALLALFLFALAAGSLLVPFAKRRKEEAEERRVETDY